jgi:DNA processing protein
VTKQPASQVEDLFDRIGDVVRLSDPLTYHPNTYANVLQIPMQQLLENHSLIKGRFLRLEVNDQIIKRDDVAYPACLSAEVAPRFLYARGDISLLKEKCVAIIGNRNPSNEGKVYTQSTVAAIASHNVVTVSGLGRGIEGIAHISALSLGNPTIAFLSSSLIETYPEEHRDLQRVIGERGLLVTQFSPAATMQKWHIPMRNQLMSALCAASVIIEERDGGAAVKQAYYALQQQRKVVLFQHALDNRSLLWPRKLALMPQVVVVRKPQLLHARVFPSSQKTYQKQQPQPQETQLSLFDLS